VDNARKKDLAREYKELKPRAGIFAVRRTATGEVWVGKAPEPERKRTAVWFQLEIGSFPNREMQAAWNAHGKASFAFELLEQISDENELLVPSCSRSARRTGARNLTRAPWSNPAACGTRRAPSARA